MHSPLGFNAGGRLPPARVARVRSARPSLTFEIGVVALDKLRTNFTLLMVSAYLVLNAGFMMLRIPPTGQGAPLGEIWLAIMLATIFLDLRFVKAFANWTPIIPLFCWWLLGLAHLIIDIPEYGFWAVRDAGHWLESNYLWVGFALACREDFYPKFERWLRLTFNVAVYYMLTYPFRATISALSPKVDAVAGYSLPIIGNYLNGSGNIMTGFFRVLLERHGSVLKATARLLIASLALVIMVIFFQMRTAYLQFLAAIALLMFCRARNIGRLGFIILAGLLCGAIVLNLNIDLTGRTGEKFSLDWLANHIEAIWGAGGYVVRGQNEGVDLRFNWWSEVFAKVNSSVGSGLFGLGFGEALTNFRAIGGVLVREVHNSPVSVYGRLGAVGLALFVLIQFRIFFVGLRLIALLKRLGKQRVVVTVATTLCFMAMSLIFAQFEPGLELSYVCIPYYFFGGIIFGLNRRIRLEIRDGPPAVRTPRQLSA